MRIKNQRNKCLTQFSLLMCVILWVFCLNIPKEKRNKENLERTIFKQECWENHEYWPQSSWCTREILKHSLNFFLLNKTAENLYLIYPWNNLTIMWKDLTWNNLIRVQSDHESFFWMFTFQLLTALGIFIWTACTDIYTCYWYSTYNYT